jgi:multicomponent Na+:H+ antiporter subunit E
MVKPMTKTGLITRIAILAFIWWVLTKGAVDSWIVGVPAISAATAIDVYFFRPGGNRWSWGGLIVFILFFLKSSISSGLDVVRRTYHPRLPLEPAMIEYPLNFASPAARDFFVCTVSLLPGTLSAGFEGDRLVVHALDVGRPVVQELDLIQQRVAAVFKEQDFIDQSKGGMQ